MLYTFWIEICNILSKCDINLIGLFTCLGSRLPGRLRLRSHRSLHGLGQQHVLDLNSLHLEKKNKSVFAKLSILRKITNPHCFLIRFLRFLIRLNDLVTCRQNLPNVELPDLSKCSVLKFFFFQIPIGFDPLTNQRI